MKVCIIQPTYEMNHAKTADISAWILSALDACDDSMDLIVLPESSDVPCFAKDKDFPKYYNTLVLSTVSQPKFNNR